MPVRKSVRYRSNETVDRFKRSGVFYSFGELHFQKSG